MRDALGSVQSVLVLGGTSEIGLAIARALVAERARTVTLAGRDPEALGAAADGLRAAGASSVDVLRFDAADRSRHGETIDAAFDAHGDVDVVVLAFGLLGEQEELIAAPEAAADLVEVNFTGAVSALLAAAQRLRRQGHGTIVVLSSVAGERARRKNFVYGASKAGLDAFAQGLGDELAADGIDVLVVRPGMVRTKMTAHMDDAPFTTTPEKVAADVVAAIRRRDHTIWSPRILRLVMAVLRHLPRPLFRRLDL